MGSGGKLRIERKLVLMLGPHILIMGIEGGIIVQHNPPKVQIRDCAQT